VGEIGPFSEVELHQVLLDARGIAAVSRPQDEAMTIKRIGLAADLVGGIDQTFRGRRGADALGDRSVTRNRTEFGFEIGLAIDAVGRDPRIEEIGLVFDLDRYRGIKRQRAFETVLADIAPWADHIRDDVDMHPRGGRSGRHMKLLNRVSDSLAYIGSL